jgi:hypothetical protein
MEIELRVYISGQFESWGAAVKVPELYRETFDPLKTCDDPILACATGEFMENSDVLKLYRRAREDAAKILADELTKLIVSAMRKDDTHNGYKVNESLK